MARKCLLIGLAVIFLIISGGVVGCGKGGITGTYVNEDNPDEYLELKADGTYYLYESGISVTGEWETSGDELRLELWGFVVTGEIRGNKIYDPDGKVWVKQSQQSVTSRTDEESVRVKPAVDTPTNFDSWAEEAITWAENQLGSDHWYELCLRFVANAFMQQGNPPVEVPEGVWDSAWDAVDGDDELDLVLQDTDDWRNTPRGGLIFFSQTRDNHDGHVGIYLGDSEIIHAYGRVRIDSMTAIGNLDGGKYIGPYIGWAYPPERWRPKTASPDQVVIFDDPNLEAAIREAISKPIGTINVSELEALTSLEASERSITDLTGLQYCTNLTKLYLGANQISDISPLTSLANLTLLWLNDNQISNISPLISLTKLNWLNLGGNQISDISLLSSMTNLIGLYLCWNQISNLSPLTALTNLTFLSLDGNQVSNLSPVAFLTSLTRLDLISNPVSDISPLASLTNLTELYLGANQISDISPLTSLTNLNRLYLFDNQISDISPLISLTKLNWLNLGGNQISDISLLSSMTNLTNLLLFDNQISNISPLASLANLTELDLNDNRISDIKPLVANSGLSDGDTVTLTNNPLNTTSVNIYIPQLQQRGVKVEWTAPSTTFSYMTYLGMNAQVEPFYGWRVRRAVYLSLDRDGIVSEAEEAFDENVEKVVSIVTPSIGCSYIDCNRDTSRAKILLIEAGYPDGFIIDLYVPFGFEGIAEQIAIDLAESGIDVKIQALDLNTFNAGKRTGKWDFFLADAIVNWDDTSELLGRLLLSGSIEISTGFSNPTFEQLFYSGSFSEAEELVFGADGGFPTIAPLFWH